MRLVHLAYRLAYLWARIRFAWEKGSRDGHDECVDYLRGHRYETEPTDVSLWNR